MGIRLEIELSRVQKKIVRLAVVGSTVVAVVGIGVAVGAPRHTFVADQPVVAVEMNENFAELHARLDTARMVGTGGPQQSKYSTGFTTFKGRTAGSYTGKEVGGYAGAKIKCEAEIKSASAHMCTNEELIRSEQLGIIVASNVGEDGWFAAGVTGVNYVSPLAYGSDCLHWSSDGNTPEGSRWLNGSSTCNNAAHILCCD